MTNEQLDKLGRGRKLNIAVVGDIILDVYRYGTIERISPEFPVPILKEEYDKPIYLCGGASNVASQFIHLNADVKLYGFADEECINHISGFGFDVSRVIKLETGKVPRKVRLFAKNHPVLRMDRESDNCGIENIKDERAKVLKNLIQDLESKVDVVIFSNYAKGLFDENFAKTAIAECRKYGIPTIVDPKKNPEWWKGCFVFKPNASEAKSMCRSNNLEESVSCLMEEVKCEYCVVTREGSGVLINSKDKVQFYKPNKILSELEVNNVSGAGDAFTSCLAFAVGHGINIENSVEFAFQAASEYVKAKHNRPVSFYEIKRRIDPLGAKIITAEEAEYLRKNVFSDQKWVMSNGTYDGGITTGHVKSLNFAKSQGDKLIIAVNSDQSVKRYKGESRPIFNLEERMGVLCGLESVDFVVSFDEDTPIELIKKIKPDCLVKGAEYKKKDVAGFGLTEIILCPMNDSISTTEKIRRIIDAR